MLIRTSYLVKVLNWFLRILLC